MDWIVAHWDILSLLVLNGLGLAALAAKLTPTTTDDEWIAKIESVVAGIVNKPKA